MDSLLYLELYIVRKVLTRRIQRRWNEEKRFSGSRERKGLSGKCLVQGGEESVQPDKCLRTTLDVGRGTYAMWGTCVTREIKYNSQGQFSNKANIWSLIKAILDIAPEPSVLHQNHYIYISLERYLQGESNGIGFVAWGEDSTENVGVY